MKRATGAVYALAGLVLCLFGFKTLLPAVVMETSDFEKLEFSMSLAWPGLLMLVFIIAYINMLGKNFFLNS